MTTATTIRGLCASCDADLDHCHGVLVLHADGTVDCHADQPCDDPSLGRHDWRSACDQLDERCGCGVPAAA